MRRIPFPICSVCNRPVERMEMTQLVGKVTSFRAECHGEMDFTSLTEQQILDAEKIEPGYAFRDSPKHERRANAR